MNAELIQALKSAVATVFSFYLKTYNCHWNVTGDRFFMYHQLYEEIYTDVHQSVDQLAEAIRKQGGYAPGGLKRYAELSPIEDLQEHTTAERMCEILHEDNKLVLQALYRVFAEAEKVNAQGVVDLIGTRISQHEKWEWFLRAQTQKD